MADRSPTEAAEAFLGSLQRAVSCVTPAVLVGRGSGPGPESRLLSFGGEEPVRVGRQGDLYLTVELWYRLAETVAAPRSWRAQTVGYEYRLLARDGQDILTYHWHPVGRSPVTHPHLHVGGRTEPVDLSRAHLPTGRISLVDVLRLAVADLGVRPLRADWREVFGRAEADLAG